MNEQGENRTNLWTSVVFVLFFLLSVNAFSNYPDKNTDTTSKREVALALHSNIFAVCDFQKGTGDGNKIGSYAKPGLKLFITGLNTYSGNKSLNLLITFLQKTEFLREPVSMHWFYCQYHYPAPDVPHLG